LKKIGGRFVALSLLVSLLVMLILLMVMIMLLLLFTVSDVDFGPYFFVSLSSKAREGKDQFLTVCLIVKIYEPEAWGGS